jgi:hypothetical protein
MKMESDELRCPACGCADVRVMHQYTPGMWGTGRGQCLACRCTFSFKWFEEEEEPSQAPRPFGVLP